MALVVVHARRGLLLLLVILPLVGVFLLTAVPPLIAQENDQTLADDMFAALNEWRLEQNLAPFQYNPTLEALAMLQLRHVLALPNIPPSDYIHDGILGEGPRDRGLWPPYSWPHYDNPARVNLVEIIVAQPTVAKGIVWWKNSPIHNESVTNPNYREAGVVAMPYEYGTVFVAVLAGRPNVLPAMIHPDGATLYLTQDSFWGAALNQDYLAEVTEVRLLDSDQTPLIDWQPWTATLPLPDVSGDTLVVEYTDGTQTVTTTVNITEDIFPLMGYESVAVNAAEEEVAEVSTTEAPTPNVAEVSIIQHDAEALIFHVATTAPLYLADFLLLPLSATINPGAMFSDAFAGIRFARPDSCFVLWVTGAEPPALPGACTGAVIMQPLDAADAFWRTAEQQPVNRMFILDDDGALLDDCLPETDTCTFTVAAAAPPATGKNFQRIISKRLRLVYNDNSVAIINESGQYLDLYGLTLTNGTVSVQAYRWAESMSGADLGHFPTGDCIQVWPSNTRIQPTPSGCTNRQGWMTIRQREVFWRGETFDVLYNNRPLATCELAKGECEIELP